VPPSWVVLGWMEVVVDGRPLWVYLSGASQQYHDGWAFVFFGLGPGRVGFPGSIRRADKFKDVRTSTPVLGPSFLLDFAQFFSTQDSWFASLWPASEANRPETHSFLAAVRWPCSAVRGGVNPWPSS